MAILLAFLFPATGVVRALNSLARSSILKSRNQLQIALKTGTLCMAVRSNTWIPHKGDMMDFIHGTSNRCIFHVEPKLCGVFFRWLGG